MKAMRRHIKTLARKHGIKIYPIAKTDLDCRASKKAMRIICLPVVNRRAYLLAAHELFHIIFPIPRKVLDREMVAWEGVKNNAIDFKESDNSVISECLKSYIGYYKGDRRVKVSKEFRVFIQSLI